MAKVTRFSSVFGMSLEIKGVWHKFQCGIEIEPEEGDDLEKIKEKAHNTVVLEVEKQFQKALESMGEGN
jgi:DNA/RNA endonuclease YhcR with UshA esterase domain